MASEVCCLVQDLNLNDHSKGGDYALKGGFGRSKSDGDLWAKPVMTTITPKVRMASEVCCLVQDTNHSKGLDEGLKGGFCGSKADGDLCGKPVMTTINNLLPKQQPSDIDYDIMKGKRVLEWEDKTDVESDSDSDFDSCMKAKRVDLMTDEEILHLGQQWEDLIRRRRILDEEKPPEWKSLYAEPPRNHYNSEDEEYDLNPEHLDPTLLEFDFSDPKWDKTFEQFEKEYNLRNSCLSIS